MTASVICFKTFLYIEKFSKLFRFENSLLKFLIITMERDKIMPLRITDFQNNFQNFRIIYTCITKKFDILILYFEEYSLEFLITTLKFSEIFRVFNTTFLYGRWNIFNQTNNQYSIQNSEMNIIVDS